MDLAIFPAKAISMLPACLLLRLFIMPPISFRVEKLFSEINLSISFSVSSSLSCCGKKLLITSISACSTAIKSSLEATLKELIESLRCLMRFCNKGRIF